MTDELRNVILNAHNDFRKKLVNGKVKDAKGNLPTGKNIYKFSYNKNKEYIAQKTANICKMEHPGTVGYGENLYANSWAMDNLTEAMLGAANGWWDEKNVCPITNDAGNILIYEKGQRCRKDSDYTWYKNSKCEIKTGLCLAPKDAKDPKIK
uniref:SCP domain-containing protein n=1 Tax=Meloidogyne javanica TaxID=6303 RepID=A0A915LYV0_MELJA